MHRRSADPPSCPPSAFSGHRYPERLFPCFQPIVEFTFDLRYLNLRLLILISQRHIQATNCIFDFSLHRLSDCFNPIRYGLLLNNFLLVLEDCLGLDPLGSVFVDGPRYGILRD